MKRKTKKWIKKHLNIYNLSIIGLVLIIIISLCIIFRENIGNIANSISSNIKGIDSSAEEKELDGVKIVSSSIKQDEEITEEKARKMAVKQFKRLGEKIKEDELKVTPIRRNGERYYYIITEKNTLEIKILGGEITRINSKIVE